MTLNYVLGPILVQNPENEHFEGIYLFPLHQHTAAINSTIRRHSYYINYLNTEYATFSSRAIVNTGWLQ